MLVDFILSFAQVIYKNVKPQFMEFGPYIYRESDIYSNLSYADL